jgi:MFS family permease
MAAVLGVFALNWDVALPLYATTEFDGGASLYGFFVSTMGVGAFIGAMVVLRTTRVAGSYFRAAGLLMTVAFVILALTPVLPGAFAGLALLGAASTSFQIFAQSRLQLEADDRLSGRILALYGMALVGTRPIGALITGSIVDATNPRVALAVNATVVAILVVMILLTRQRAVEIPRGTPVALPLDADDDVTDQTDPSARRPAASGD